MGLGRPRLICLQIWNLEGSSWHKGAIFMAIRTPMHVINPIFGPLSIHVPCMHVKFVTLRVISNLGAQIYLVDEFCTLEIEL